MKSRGLISEGSAAGPCPGRAWSGEGWPTLPAPSPIPRLRDRRAPSRPPDQPGPGGVEVVGDMIGKALQHPPWILQTVPARHLNDDRRRSRDAVLLGQLRDPAPLLGGVEVPKAPACELIGGMLQAAHEATTLVWVKDSFEPPRVELRNRNIVHQRACCIPRQWQLSYGGCSCRRGPLPEAAAGNHDQPSWDH